MTQTYDIAIVGAGPVGLTLACALHGSGLSVAVFEAEETIATTSRASTFHAPTLEMLDRIGITPRLIERGLVVPTWEFRLHPEGRRAAFDMSVLADETPYPFRLQVEQSVLAELLLDDLKARGETALHFATRVEGIEQDGDGVTFTALRGEDREPCRARFLIGCDGSHSTVRKEIDMPFEGSVYEESTILIAVPFPFDDHLPDLSDVAYCWNRSGGMFALIRVPQYWRISFYPQDGQSVEQALEPSAVQAMLRGIVPGAGEFPVEGGRVYRAHQRIVQHYRRGRVVLAGDAAHIHASSGGTGMNGGIHDAFCLLEYLVPVAKGERPIEDLDIYERRRRTVTLEEVMPVADRARKIIYEKDPAKRLENFARLEEIVSDRARMKEYLLNASMINGVRRSNALASV